MSREPIPQHDALLLQLAAIAGDEPATSFFEFRPLDPDGRPGSRRFVPVRDLEAAASCALEHSKTMNAFVGVAPRIRENGTAKDVERVYLLWVDVDGAEALTRLRAFEPKPHIVIRSGSPDSVHAYWCLSSAVSPAAAQRANRRLAVALGADMAATDPARILRCAGTLNWKHPPPASVECVLCDPGVYELEGVVAHLRDSEHYAPRLRERRHFHTSDSSKVLAGLVRVVAEAEIGSRNRCLFWSCCRVAEHDDLDQAAAIEQIRAAALHAGLDEHEIDRTVGSALNARAAA